MYSDGYWWGFGARDVGVNLICMWAKIGESIIKAIIRLNAKNPSVPREYASQKGHLD